MHQELDGLAPALECSTILYLGKCCHSPQVQSYMECAVPASFTCSWFELAHHRLDQDGCSVDRQRPWPWHMRAIMCPTCRRRWLERPLECDVHCWAALLFTSRLGAAGSEPLHCENAQATLSVKTSSEREREPRVPHGTYAGIDPLYTLPGRHQIR